MYLETIGGVNPSASAVEQARITPPAPVETPAVAAAVQAVDGAHVNKALEAANRMVQSLGIGLQFSIDQETGKTLIQVIDTSTNQLIRQIPAEEMLTISRALDKLQGLLIKQRA